MQKTGAALGTPISPDIILYISQNESEKLLEIVKKLQITYCCIYATSLQHSQK